MQNRYIHFSSHKSIINHQDNLMISNTEPNLKKITASQHLIFTQKREESFHVLLIFLSYQSSIFFCFLECVCYTLSTHFRYQNMCHFIQFYNFLKQTKYDSKSLFPGKRPYFREDDPISGKTTLFPYNLRRINKLIRCRLVHIIVQPV